MKGEEVTTQCMFPTVRLGPLRKRLWGGAKWLRSLSGTVVITKNSDLKLKKAGHGKETERMLYLPSGAGHISCLIPMKWEWPREVGKRIQSIGPHTRMLV